MPILAAYCCRICELDLSCECGVAVACLSQKASHHGLMAFFLALRVFFFLGVISSLCFFASNC